MRHNFSIPLLFAILLGTASVPASAQAPGSDSYQRAVQAINRGDCTTAIIELEKFKAEAQARLKENPAFQTTVDEQIQKCRQRLGAAPVQPKGGGTEIRGFKRPDSDARAMQREMGRSIQFRTF